MWTLLTILGSSFLLGLALTPIVRSVASRCGLVDQPDGGRKVHARPIPVSGGIAVFFAACTTLAAACLWSQWLAEGLATDGNRLVGLLLASAFICLVGLIDDFRVLRGRHKLFGQLVAVAIVMVSGVVVRRIGVFGQNWELGSLSYLFTGFLLLGAINSLNLIDGMDGLLSCLATIISLAMGVMAFVAGQFVAAAVAFALAGALLAFLCFNFPPASIFLGDCGSMLVGLVVGTLAITTSLKGSATVVLATPAAMFAIPIFDTLAAIIRRKLTGRSIYSTDRAHIHHCLMRSGLSARKALFFLAFLCLLTVFAAFASVAVNSELLSVISILAVAIILVVTRLFGHAEFLLMKERLIGVVMSFFSWGTRQSEHALEVRLQGSADWKELWRSLTACASKLDLRTVRLDVNAPAIYEGYHARWDRFDQKGDTQTAWRFETPLVVRGQIVGRLEVAGNRDDEPARRKVAKMAKLAEDVEQAVTRLTSASPVPSPAAGVTAPEAPFAQIGKALNLRAMETEGSPVV